MNTSNGTTQSKALNVTAITMASFVTLVALITLIYNIIILIAFIRDKSIRTPFNFYLLNLTLADLGMAIGGMGPFVANVLNGVTPFGFNMCSLTLWSNLTTASGCAHAVMLISLDRVWSLFWPIQYRNRRSAKVTLAACVGMWVYVNCWTVALTIRDRLYFPMIPALCIYNGNAQKTFKTSVEVMLFDVPLSVVILSYTAVILKLATRKRLISPVKSLENKPKQSDAEKKEAKSIRASERHEKKLFLALSWLAVLMFILWTPASIFFLLDSLLENVFHPTVFAVVICLQYASSVINPFVYHSTLPDIKRAVNDFLRCRKSAGRKNMFLSGSGTAGTTLSHNTADG